MSQKKFSLTEHIKNGLTISEVVLKRRKYGVNVLKTAPLPSDLYFLLQQFKNPLVLVLSIAVLVTLVLGHGTDAIVILLAIAINTALGFFQERKAFKSVYALKKLVSHEIDGIRDGKRLKIAVADVVPGDIIKLFEGDKVPADGLLLESTDLLIEEAFLTGESVPVMKRQCWKDKKYVTSLEEFLKNVRTDNSISSQVQVYMGSTIIAGAGVYIVSKTGMDTAVGSIASHLDEYKEVETPLEKKLAVLAKHITRIIIVLSLFIFAFGVFLEKDPVEMFTVAVALAVAAIPEGLVVALTAILAVGMNRILKRKGLVKSLTAAETLGGVTTVCLDKTGTLTEGKMRVVETKFTDEQLAYKASTLANDMRDLIETARWDWAKKISKKSKKYKNPQTLTELFPRDDSIPFSVKRRFLATRHGKDIFLSGAPEEMLARSNITKKMSQEYYELLENWALLGKRVIGFGYIKAKSDKEADSLFHELKKGDVKVSKVRWMGVMAFEDPVRDHVATSIKAIEKAGVTFKVITGDFRTTAVSIMKKIGFDLKESEVMEGAELEKISDVELQEKVKEVVLFTRTQPSQKLKIVKALQNNDEVVGMMGDGVNDAPALAAADIGIVVENASDVAKEASDLILLDSNMETITASVEEGRSMMDNIKKVAFYLLSDSFSEILIVMVGLMLGWPTTISAVQILWINLIDDGFPSLALTVDTKAPDLMKRKPLEKGARLLDTMLISQISIISLVTASSSLVIFYWYWMTGDEVLARTMVFATLSVDSLLYSFSCRALDKNISFKTLFKNAYLVLAVLSGLVFTILSIHFGPFQRLLGTVALNMEQWTVVFGVGFLVIILIEFFKWVRLQVLSNVARKKA